MYCRYCGKELPDNAKFCTVCGAAQGGGAVETHPKRSKTSIVIISVLAVLVVALVAVVLAILAGGVREDGLGKALRMDVPTIAAAPTFSPALPQDGWYEADGERYYYEDGCPLTGLQEIGDSLYYFYEDGTLAVNAAIPFEEDSLEFGNQGQLIGITFGSVPCQWSDESFSFGNGGQAAILEIDGGVGDCRSFTLYLEASGQHGTHFNGTWKLYIRSHGRWEYAEDIHFVEPDGYFPITFSSPKDFDAITVYPTIQGNATYNVYFNLYDVYCRP